MTKLLTSVSSDVRNIIFDRTDQTRLVIYKGFFVFRKADDKCSRVKKTYHVSIS